MGFWPREDIDQHGSRARRIEIRGGAGSIIAIRFCIAVHVALTLRNPSMQSAILKSELTCLVDGCQFDSQISWPNQRLGHICEA